jgi:cell division septation protein DedD
MEGKKVLWVVFSIALALVVILAAGLFLLRPRQPASAAQVRPGTAPSLQGYDPYEYVRGTSAPPGLTPPPAESGPVVIVVGEPPAGQPPAQAVEPAIAPLESPQERASAVPAPAAQGAAKPERPSAPQERAPQERVAAAAAAKPSAKPAAKPSAKPAAKPKSVSVTEYWIQAGSFSSASRADEVSRPLEERGLATRTITRDLNGKTHFRVRVGPYASRAEAEKFLGWIQELKGFESSYISMVASRRSMP